MKLSKITFVLLFAAGFSHEACSAISCVQNKESGFFENKTINRNSSSNGVNVCDATQLLNTMKPLASMRSIQDVSTQSSGQVDKTQLATVSHITVISEKITKWDVLASDVRLATTFERWGQIAGWRVQWDAAKHFLIDGTSTFTGSFEDAVKAALMTPGIRLGAYPLEACVYSNTPPLLRITRQGEQTQECAD